MPLDRRITVIITADGEYDQYGEFQPGVPVEYPMWAEQRGAGSVDTNTPGGIYVSAVRSYTVRYSAALVDASIATVTIRDADGNIWNADSISESDARKRYIGIDALREA